MADPNQKPKPTSFDALDYFEYVFHDLDLSAEEAHARVYAVTGQHPSTGTVEGGTPLDMGAVAAVEEQAAQGVKFAELAEAPMSFQDPGAFHQAAQPQQVTGYRGRLAGFYEAEDAARREEAGRMATAAPMPSASAPVIGMELESALGTDYPGLGPQEEAPKTSPTFLEAVLPEPIQDVGRVLRGEPAVSPASRSLGEMLDLNRRERARMHPALFQATTEEGQPIYADPSQDPFYQRMEGQFPVPGEPGGEVPDVEGTEMLPIGEQPGVVEREKFRSFEEARGRDILVPPETEDDFKKWGARLAGTWEGASEGLANFFVRTGEDISDLVDEVSRFEAHRLSKLARLAKARGEPAISTGMSTPSMFAGEKMYKPMTLNVDDVIQDDAKAAADFARMASRTNKIREAHERQMEHLQTMLKSDPDFDSTHTLKFWREGISELLSGLGQLTLFMSGVKDPDEPAEASAMEALLASRAMAKPMIENLGNEAVAGWALTFHSPEAFKDSVQVYGPLVALDVLPYLKGLKAAATAGKIFLPAGAIAAADKVIDFTKPMVKYLRDAPLPVVSQIRGGEGGTSAADVWHSWRRLFADASSNTDKLVSDFYVTAAREGAEQQNAIESAMSAIAAEAAEGRVKLKPREAFAETEHRLYEAELVAWQKHADELYEKKLKEEGLAAEVTKPDMPPTVRERIEARLADDTDEWMSKQEIEADEMQRFVDEGGTLTAKRTLPGTKEQGYIHYDLSPDDATLWDAVVKEFDADIGRAEKLKDKKHAGKKVAELYSRKKEQLKEIGEGIHQQQARLKAGEKRLQAIRKRAESEAAEYIRDQRSAFGVTGRLDPREVPIQSRVYIAEATIDLKDGQVAYTTQTPRDRAEFAESLKDRGLSKSEIDTAWAQRYGEGAYRGVERRQGVGAPEGVDVVTPRPEYSPRAQGAKDRIVELMSDSPEEAMRLGSEIDANVARSIDEMLAEWTRSAEARSNLAARLTDIIYARTKKSSPMSDGMRSTVQGNIARLLEEAQARKVPESGAPGSALPHNLLIEVKLPNGRKLAPINLIDEVAGIVMKNDDAAKRIMSESINHTAVRMGIRHAQKVMQNTYLTELEKGFAASKVLETRPEYGGRPHAHTEAARAVASVLDEGSLPSMVLFRPSAVAEEMGSALSGERLNKMVSDVKKLTGKEYSLREVQLAINEGRRRIKRYDDLGAESHAPARLLMRVGDDLYNKARVDRVEENWSMAQAKREVEIEMRPSWGHDPETGLPRGLNEKTGTVKAKGSVYIQKNLMAALDNYGKAQEAVANASLALMATTQLKSNLTARQITTLKNNLLSNVMLQSIRRGSATVLPDLINSIVKWKRYEQGRGVLSEAELKRVDEIYAKRDRYDEAHAAGVRGEELHKLEPTPAERAELAEHTRKREDLTDDEVEMFHSLSMSGKVKTSFVDAELGGMLNGGVIGTLIRQGAVSEKTGKWLRKAGLPMEKLEDIYRFSDEAFKIDEGIRSWKIIGGWENKLKVGQFMELRVGPTRKVRATKLADGSFEVGGKKLTKTQWNGLKGRASMQVGEDLFFNFLDVPDFARFARISPIVAALASPFYTWLNKAMDIPGFKRGLVTETLTGTPFVHTDNLAIHGDVFGRQAAIGSAINIMQAGSAVAPYDAEAMRELRKIQGWGLQEQAMVINHMEMGQLLSSSLTQANPYSGASLFMRAIESGFSGVSDTIAIWESKDPWTYKAKQTLAAYQRAKLGDKRAEIPLQELAFDMVGRPPEEVRQVTELRKWLMEHGTGKAGITLSDGLDLVGLAGHPILEVWHMAAEAERRGKATNWAGVYRRAGSMLIGGTYAKGIDAIIGGIPPTTRVSTRYDFRDPLSGEEEKYFSWAIRHVTGVGWKRQNVHKRGKKYYDQLKQRWSDTLVAPILKDARSELAVYTDPTRTLGDRTTALERHTNAMTLAYQLKGIVDKEMGLAYGRHIDLMIKHGIHEKTVEGWTPRLSNIQGEIYDDLPTEDPELE